MKFMIVISQCMVVAESLVTDVGVTCGISQRKVGFFCNLFLTSKASFPALGHQLVVVTYFPALGHRLVDVFTGLGTGYIFSRALALFPRLLSSGRPRCFKIEN